MNSQREYKAFISYRHTPADMCIAKAVHRYIENYTIPPQLRKSGGKKKIGIVYRDQEEINVSGNLTENIFTALDHSEFLIVVCSRSTKNNIWIEKEVQHFLKNHDKEHLLIVLTEGDIDTSCPAVISEQSLNDSGYDPRYADIVSKTQIGKLKKFYETEGLRLVAALIGCPFAEIYKRATRKRIKSVVSVFVIIISVISLFLGMLHEKNKTISIQYEESQINESQALAALSSQNFKQGDYFCALRQVLSALPDTGQERPYVSEAEKVLTEELYLSDMDGFCYTASARQQGVIQSLALSADGRYAVTTDSLGYVRKINTVTGDIEWSINVGDVEDAVFADNGDIITICNTCRISADGRMLYAFNYPDNINRRTFISTNRRLALYTSLDDELRPIFHILDLEQGRDCSTGVIPVEFHVFRECCAAFSEDGKYAALVLNDFTSMTELMLFDVFTGKTIAGIDISEEIISDMYTDYKVKFTSEGDIILACHNMDYGVKAIYFENNMSFQKKWSTKLGTSGESFTYESGAISLSGSVDVLYDDENYIYIAAGNSFFFLDSAEGMLLKNFYLPGSVKSSLVYDGIAALLMENGDVRPYFDSGVVMPDRYSFSAGRKIYVADISGERFTDSVLAFVSDEDRSLLSFVRYKKEYRNVILSIEGYDSWPEYRVFATSEGNIYYIIKADSYYISGYRVDSINDSVMPFNFEINREIYDLISSVGLIVFDDTIQIGRYVFDVSCMQIREIDEEEAKLRREKYYESMHYADADKISMISQNVSSAVSNVMLLEDNKYAVVFCNTGYIEIYDLHNGIILDSLPTDITFKSVVEASYSAYTSDDGKYIYLSYNDNHYLAIGLSVSTSDMSISGIYKRTCHYCPDRNMFISLYSEDGIYFSGYAEEPAMSCNEKIQIANGILKGET